MFGFATGVKVNVGVITRRAAGLNRGVLHLLRQLLKCVIDLLRDQRSLLAPAFLAGCSAYPGKPSFAFEYVDAISVLHSASFAKDRGHTISENSLRRGDVSDLLHPAASTATGEQE